MITQGMIQDALRYMGIRQGEAEESLVNQVKQELERLEEQAQIKWDYKLLPIKISENNVELVQTPYKIESKDLATLLKHSEKCYILAATLGVEVDRQISKKQYTNMFEAVMLDACASVLIDKVCDDIEVKIMEALPEGKYLTMRFSPGYGDVPLEASSAILDLLLAHRRLGLMMTDSHMLVPTKSITAIIGQSNQKEDRQKNCGKCYLVKTCMYRRRGERCGK